MRGTPVSDWARAAIETLDATREAEGTTPLRRFPLPGDDSVGLFVKDESARPTGSLKHGLARGLLVDALHRGLIDEGTPLVEATSGNLAVAEAHFARLLGLPFTAVVPRRTGRAKLARIEERGGRWHPVDPPLAVYDRARRLAADTGGHYLDHLEHLGGAVDRDGPENLAAEILRDLDRIGGPAPAWIVAGVGTGATSRAIGRHLRRTGSPTRTAVVDSENSAYFPGWATGCDDYATGMPSKVEGIGRPRIEAPFDGSVVDLVIPVPDATSVAATRHLRAVTGWVAGPSSGACLVGAFHLVSRMRERGESGAVVMVLGDSGLPYADTYYDDGWVAARGWDLAAPAAALERFADTGRWGEPPSA
ncbi:PLP-dependent cysteine synthase family protein [Umezawaea endophytica]|uniref:Pyridoxal-phosphate dependent enzyme n=1 Tax=Umezawaea endophytica TaxID=1654476 RepID=A0A9X2VFH3_9PSEU|nr:pyridoxal-phosphate dependent enzyme [Umezawaea endophytica]MCS7475671.1 pyridoxal-phosphate dependent enzyme [Umezawaea endophytica]